MRKSTLLLAASLASSLLFSACAGTATGTTKPGKLGKYDSAVEYYSLGIKQKVEIGDLNQRKTGDVLQAHATIRNKTGKEQKLVYKFRFFDKDGFEVGTDNRPWVPVTIQAKDTATVQATAPDNKANYFKVIVSN